MYKFLTDYDEKLGSVFEYFKSKLEKNNCFKNIKVVDSFVNLSIPFINYIVLDFAYNKLGIDRRNDIGLALNYYPKGETRRFIFKINDHKVRTFVLNKLPKIIETNNIHDFRTSLVQNFQVNHFYAELNELFFNLSERVLEKNNENMFSFMQYYNQNFNVARRSIIAKKNFPVSINKFINAYKYGEKDEKKYYCFEGKKINFKLYYHFFKLLFKNIPIKDLDEMFNDHKELINKWMKSEKSVKQICAFSCDDFLLDLNYAHVMLYSSDFIEESKLEEIQFVSTYFVNRIVNLENSFLSAKDKHQIEIFHTKTAIISILVDSFAHNIAAHSLQQILKWLNKRIQYSNSKFKIGSNPELNKKFKDDELRKAIKEDQVKDQDEVKTKINDFNNIEDDELTVSSILWYNGSCVNDLRDAANIIREKLDVKNTDNYWPLSFDVFRYRYLSYINKKATLWSGVIKDSVLGGSITSWFEILYEFCYNPYFIGTIAGSEKIFKVHFRVHCHKNERVCREGKFHSSCEDSDFMTIDLRRMMGEKGELIVSGGTKFENIKKELSNKMVFLPGGDVGKHSLYTIFENTLRNVKHCDHELNREKQIEFNICINDNEQTKYYNIDIWLSNNSRFSKTCVLEKINDKFVCDEIKEIDKGLIRVFKVDHNNNAINSINNFKKTGKEITIALKNSTSSKIKVEYYYDFAKQQNKETKKEIIDENSKPRMGGTFQDKICAAELLTNAFNEVESKYKMNDKDSDNDIQFIEYKKFETEKNPDTFNGCLVTSFKVWKGENLGQIQSNKNFKPNENGLLFDAKGNIIDNLRRYRLFVAEDKYKKKDIEALGVIRVVIKKEEEIEKNITESNKKFEEYYNNWLDEWLSGYKISIGAGIQAFRNTKNNWLLNQIQLLNNNHDSNNYHKPTFSHSDTDDKLSIKNQGVGGKDFFEINEDGVINSLKKRITAIQNKELIETIGTKITVIDNRVNNLISSVGKDEEIEEGLLLKTHSEGNDEAERTANLNKLKGCNVHFLIIHLSFIDKFTKNIVEFINENLKNENDYIFKKLVITTGRGRSGWYSDIEEDECLKTKVLFIPPESLTSAISYGIMIKDEFEIKYRLIKLLMN